MRWAWSPLASLLALVALALWSRPSFATTPETQSDDTSPHDTSSARRKVHLQFGVVSAGYHGSIATQRFDDPLGASIQVQRHGGELLGGGVDAVVSSKGPVTKFHAIWGRSGFLFGGTAGPIANEAATDKTIPRHGFNFGLVSDTRGNAGVALGGACGVALSGIAGESVKAYTRSTVLGNHLELDLGVAGGLHCGRGPTFVLMQYVIEGNLGVEQMQDLSRQQGNRAYSPRAGNGLLLYAAHGPTLVLIHDSKYLHTALSAEWIRSIGQGRWGGQRWSVRGQLSLAFGEKAALGFAPWYRLDVIDYGEASKVRDHNRTTGHTFGMAFVVAFGRL